MSAIPPQIIGRVVAKPYVPPTPDPISPASTKLVLGAVAFETQECPDDLAIGAAEQMLAVHTLVGGSRVVQAFGVNPSDVTWRGRFWDQNVDLRIKQLRLYAVAGNEVLLSWKAERYYCIVRRFVPTYKGGYAEYEISVVVTRDANGAFTTSNATSIDQQVRALQQQVKAQNAYILANIPPATINASASDPNVFQPQINSLNSSIATAGPIAQNITTVGPTILAAAGSAQTDVQAFINAIGSANPNFAAATLMLSSIQAIATNVQRGQSPTSVLTQGVSLFKLAAQQYGDITQAFALAKANGQPSPFMSGAVASTVNLPPFARNS